MKRAGVFAAMIGCGAAGLEFLLIMLGIIRFGGQHAIHTDDYIQLPSWTLILYFIFPALVTACIFFYEWMLILNKEDAEADRRTRTTRTR